MYLAVLFFLLTLQQITLVLSSRPVQVLLLMLSLLTKLLSCSHHDYHCHHYNSHSYRHNLSQVDFHLSFQITTADAMEVSVSVCLKIMIIKSSTKVVLNQNSQMSFFKNIFLIFPLIHALRLSVTEEGYDGGLSPEPLVNITAVPLVSEILAVGSYPEGFKTLCLKYFFSSKLNSMH